jgi:hypothetical protein
MIIDYQLLYTAIVAISTLAYAFLTYLLVRETIRLREVQAEPEIILYLNPSDDLPITYDLIVKNIGVSVAYNVRWEFDKNSIFIKERGVDLNVLKFFTDKTDYFAPGQIYRTYFGLGSELFRKPTPPGIRMKVSFNNRRGNHFGREYLIDPSIYSGRSFVKNSGKREISESIQNISEVFSDIASGNSTLNINTYSTTDRNRELRKLKSLSKKIINKKK